MTSTGNVSFHLIRRRKLLKLSKAQLTKQCKQYNVSPIGTKNEMAFKILKQLEKNKKKKKKRNARKKKIKKNKNNDIKIATKTLRQKQLLSNSHSTNLYQTFVESEEIYNRNIIYSSLTSRGYKQMEKISTTLQGNVFIACKTSLHIDCVLIYGYLRGIVYDDIKYKMNDNHKAILQICYAYYKQDIVIKTASKCFYNDAAIEPQSENMENIIKESHFQSIFMKNNAPKSMIKHIDFFQDDSNYYLVMEKGGKEDLFEFNCKAHKLINSGKLNICDWRKTVKHIFYKIVKFIYWLHHNMNSCYLDVSLENVIISNHVYFDEDIAAFNCANVDIKFVDFGVTEMFDSTGNDMFLCNKYVGKVSYCAPKIYDKKTYMANKADIYSLGICFWLLSFGAPPYSLPNCSDPYFKVIKEGKMLKLLKYWNRLHYIDEDQLQLLVGMLCIDEKKRLSMDEIINHVWFKECATPTCILSLAGSNTVETDDDFVEVD